MIDKMYKRYKRHKRYKSYLIEKTCLPRIVQIILTLKCNRKCRHCYLEAGPGRKESMPMELRKKVIRKIAESKIQDIEFTGGEPTTEMKMLIDTLEYTKDIYKKLHNIKPNIYLQTNTCFLFGLSDAEIERELEKLKSAGVNFLGIPSDDEYHHISILTLNKTVEIASKIFEEVLTWGAGQIVAPIGRARYKIPEENWGDGGWITHDYDYITISVDGNVYPCCRQVTPSMGNLSEESLMEIINRARKRGSIFRKLAQKGKFAGLNPEKDLGISKEEFKKLIDRFGVCGACSEYFRKHKSKI